MSKGVVLYGLSDKEATVHDYLDSLFPYSLLLFIHDFAHQNVMMSSGDSKEELEYFKQIADNIYEDIKLWVKYPEQDKAFMAGYLLLHENDLSESKLNNSSYSMQSIKNYTNLLKNRLTMSLQSYFNLCNEEFSSYHKRFASDLAVEIVKLYPEIEEEIFGKENINKTQNYNSQKTLERLQNLMNWFYKEIKL